MKILFLCTGNSCRSQMAEGWGRKLGSGKYELYSAGVEKHGLNPNAVKVMAEADVDISGQYSKLIEELPEKEFDYVITLCGHAAENCPMFPGRAKRIHMGFDDPAKAEGDGQAVMDAFRRVRDEIRDYVLGLPGGLD